MSKKVLTYEEVSMMMADMNIKYCVGFRYKNNNSTFITATAADKNGRLQNITLEFFLDRLVDVSDGVKADFYGPESGRMPLPYTTVKDLVGTVYC